MRFSWNVDDPLPAALGCGRALEVRARLCVLFIGLCEPFAPFPLAAREEDAAGLPEPVRPSVRLAHNPDGVNRVQHASIIWLTPCSSTTNLGGSVFCRQQALAQCTSHTVGTSRSALTLPGKLETVRL